jgi:hypothetical protein
LYKWSNLSTLKFVSLIFDCIYHIMSAINLALSTILSSREGIVSSSSGLHSICPIYARFKPAAAPLWSKVEVILMFLKQIGLNLKVCSNNFISCLMSSDSMNLSVFFEKGSLA